MINDLSLYQDIFAKFNRDTVLLTPNRRLASTIHQLYQNYQILNENSVWITPKILPLITWIEMLWQQYADDHFTKCPQLLNSTQEIFLWEKIVTHTNCNLLQLSQTAEAIKKASSLLIEWQIKPTEKDIMLADFAALLEWHQHFDTYCRNHQLVRQASLPQMIINKIKENEITPPSLIFLVGFNEISPQTTSLLNACQMKDSQINMKEVKRHHVSGKRIRLKNNEEEYYCAARFAKTKLQNNPLNKIGCIIPELEKNRDRVKQIFSEVFQDQITTFNISAGKPLSQFPVIEIGLKLLSLNQNILKTSCISDILFSPFVADAETERLPRAHFENYLRKNNISQINISDANQTWLTLLAQYVPKFNCRIKLFFDYLKSIAANQLFSEWAIVFTKLLTILGWPGERSLTSEEYQTVETWLRLLVEFARLDQVSQEVSYHEALTTLRHMTEKQVYQPQSPEANVQVLGILEGAGLPFDYLWVTGLNDLSWPPPPKPNPFIPKKLQRELNMPHATPQRELQYCRHLLEQFIHAAPEVIFSYPHRDEEIELTASSLITHLPEIQVDALNLNPFQTTYESIYQFKKIEKIKDDKAPNLDPTEKISGGINVIKYQALCPFRAFATCRLHIQEMEGQQLGFRAKERGVILHDALLNIWRVLQNHNNLIHFAENDLCSLVNESIDQAIKKIGIAYLHRANYISLEKKRLNNLLLKWLGLEKLRSPFNVILKEEKETITINQLTLSVRIDRIDQLEDGSKLIIDYKTSKQLDLKHWFGERLEEPQLPIYLLLDPIHTAGIAFAQITTKQTSFKGLSKQHLDIKGIQLLAELKQAEGLNWQEQISQWQSTLKRLSDDFCQGEAQVSPKHQGQTCQWCALKPLCRIQELESYHDTFVA